ncbi:uncharacterized protein ARMOST_20628 [Armillaria ostoyae]|uniref:Uncharacterized protein n=1 Tax=Armillaria ostoyae TaxID=47428 RepID=A0A284S804_ARMOS|nr:uncharacterized protein ARMOST_20628 [Armillaria ostoyae]
MNDLFCSKFLIEAIEASPTQANANVTFAQSEPFQVDEGLTGDISASSTRDFSSPTSSACVDCGAPERLEAEIAGDIGSEARSMAAIPILVVMLDGSEQFRDVSSLLRLFFRFSAFTMQVFNVILSNSITIAPATPSKYGHKPAIIVGVVFGTFLLALITTILLIWRCRKRRALPHEGAFPTNLENDRQHIIWPYLKRLSIPPLRAFFHDEREHINHYPDVPPPPYSPLVTSE